MESTIHPAPWSPLKRFSFRYIFVFFTLIILPFPLSVIPWIGEWTEFYSDLYPPLVDWVGTYLLGIADPIVHEVTGSGDTLYDWVWYLVLILLTVLIGTIFTVADRHRKNYERLYGWFLLILSYYLAYTLLSYGIIKLFHLQFSPPGLSRLFNTYGQSSPMRLVWTFMGSSATYTIFAGASETLAGILLLFRRTRTVGALLAFGVMFNVFMLNMSYDIPVKLFSLQLVVISVYIAARHWRRLYTFFLTEQAVPAPSTRSLVSSNRAWWVLVAVQVLFGGFVIISQFKGAKEGRDQYGVGSPRSALYGVYNVDHFVMNGDTIPDRLSDTVRWKRIIFDYPKFTPITMMNDHDKYFGTEIDTTARTIMFTQRGENQEADAFTYERSDGELLLKGMMNSDTLEVHLKPYDLSRFGLLNRGFHWVNEVPYNRYNYD
ncbi:DoxX family protein [Neolewinella persica]|uniref:DoxX family protein n=1 Tax=Neolewinella persica TaxID=70998 RepID=UPI0005C50CBA|nr:DoxX family protein [Neolewinella persica]